MKYIRLLIELSLIVIGTLGIIFTAMGGEFMGSNGAFMFFTVQSNITIILITLVFLINNVLVLLGKKSFVNQWLLLIKYVFTVAITITFLVFFTLLTPQLPPSYLLSFNNFSLHAIVPILAMVDFFLFDKDINLTKINCLWACAMPVYYLIFVMVGYPLGFRYGGELKFPYFFLDFESNGWFSVSSKGLGVFYWIIILLVAIAGLCYLYYFFMILRQGKLKKRN